MSGNESAPWQAAGCDAASCFDKTGATCLQIAACRASVGAAGASSAAKNAPRSTGCSTVRSCAAIVAGAAWKAAFIDKDGIVNAGQGRSLLDRVLDAWRGPGSDPSRVARIGGTVGIAKTKHGCLLKCRAIRPLFCRTYQAGAMETSLRRKAITRTAARPWCKVSGGFSALLLLLWPAVLPMAPFSKGPGNASCLPGVRAPTASFRSGTTPIRFARQMGLASGPRSDARLLTIRPRLQSVFLMFLTFKYLGLVKNPGYHLHVS